MGYAVARGLRSRCALGCDLVVHPPTDWDAGADCSQTGTRIVTGCSRRPVKGRKLMFTLSSLHVQHSPGRVSVCRHPQR